MHVQPRQNPLSRSDFFTDQRSERPPVEGTVARGQLHDDTFFYTGKLGNNPGDYMPFPGDQRSSRPRPRALQHLLRSLPLARRATATDSFRRADSRASRRRITSCACRKRPLGYFYDVISERLRHHARLRFADSAAEIAGTSWPTSARCSSARTRPRQMFPRDKKIPSEASAFREPGSGATLPVIDAQTNVELRGTK
jgi:hypothetical protein